MLDSIEFKQRSETEQEIIRNLFNEEGLIVRQAAFDAAAAGLELAIMRLAELFFSDSVGVQEAAEYAIRKLRGPQAVKEMLLILRSENITVRNTAIDILREISMDDLQEILKYLSDDDSDVRIFVADILGYIDSDLVISRLCRTLLHDTEVNVRNQAAISLGNLKSPKAIDCLLKAFDDEDWIQYSVIEALAKIKDSSCVGALTKKLENSSDFLISFIFEAFGSIGDLKTIPLLLDYMEKSDGMLRSKALIATIQILGFKSIALLGTKQLDHLQAYILADLRKSSEENLLVLLEALSKIGKNNEATEHVLKLALSFDSEEHAVIVQKIFECIIGIGYNEALDKALHHDNQMIRAIAIDACGQIPARAGLFALKRHFEKFNTEDKLRALELLSEYGDDRDIPFFLDSLELDQNLDVIVFTLNFLGEKMQYLDAAHKMLDFLQHPDIHVKNAALNACLSLQNGDVFSIIVDLIYSEDPLMRGMAVQAMGSTNAEFFTNKLCAAMEDEETTIRMLVLEAINYGWEYSLKKIELINKCLSDSEKEVRIRAIECLEHYADELALPSIQKALGDDEIIVRLRALDAIAQNRLRMAIPSIIPLLEDSSMLIKLEVIEVLGVLGGDLAFRTLMHFIADESLDIQSAAIDAIENIRNNAEDTI